MDCIFMMFNYNSLCWKSPEGSLAHSAQTRVVPRSLPVLNYRNHVLPRACVGVGQGPSPAHNNFCIARHSNCMKQGSMDWHSSHVRMIRSIHTDTFLDDQSKSICQKRFERSSVELAEVHRQTKLYEFVGLSMARFQLAQWKSFLLQSFG